MGIMRFKAIYATSTLGVATIAALAAAPAASASTASTTSVATAAKPGSACTIKIKLTGIEAITIAGKVSSDGTKCVPTTTGLWEKIDTGVPCGKTINIPLPLGKLSPRVKEVATASCPPG
jgi:hypothetical protein